MPTSKPALLFSLTGIRGVAAVWVILFHIQEYAGTTLGHQSFQDLPILRDGFRGVDLFFILSGFIMMHAHHNDFRVITVREIYRFAALRVIRTYPLNLFVLLLILLFVLPNPGFVEWYRHLRPAYSHAFSTEGLILTSLMANRWLIPEFGEWNGPVWSLSVEVIAYLTFPALAFLAMRSRSRYRCLFYAGLAIALLIGIQAATGNAGVNITGRLSVLRALTCFPAGVALYRFVCLTRPGSDARWPSWVAAVACLALLPMLLVPHAAVLAPFCFAGLIVGLFYQRGLVDRFLRSRPAMFLGEISFALYLFHYIPLQVLFWLFAKQAIANDTASILAALAVYMAFCIVGSMLLNRFVERPAQRTGRRLLARSLSATSPGTRNFGLTKLANRPNTSS